MVHAHHDQKLLKVADVAAALQVGKTKVFEWIATGELDSFKIDGSRRITPQAVDAFIAKRQAAPKASA